MPSFVDKVGVARDCINLAAHRLEFLVEVGQILQLCGADKGKVGRVEEKYAPLAQNIRFANGTEGVVLISLNGKISNFFLNQGHKACLHLLFCSLVLTNLVIIIQDSQPVVKRNFCSCL